MGDQYILEVLLFMNKFVNNELPCSFDNVFNYNHEIQTHHVTRQSRKLYKVRCGPIFARSQPLYNFPSLWNEWDFSESDIRKTTSHVKSKVKSTLLNEYRINITCRNPLCRDCSNYHQPVLLPQRLEMVVMINRLSRTIETFLV